MSERFTNLKRQAACLTIAAVVQVPTWNGQTRLAEMVFGIAWVSFILAIFVTRSPTTPRRDYSSSSSA